LSMGQCRVQPHPPRCSLANAVTAPCRWTVAGLAANGHFEFEHFEQQPPSASAADVTSRIASLQLPFRIMTEPP
jgi:hypothetical protein